MKWRSSEFLPSAGRIVDGLRRGKAWNSSERERSDHPLQADLSELQDARRVEFSDTELPKSGSGKILKRILLERFSAHEQRAVS